MSDNTNETPVHLPVEQKITFREYLEKNTNLLTIFGIFNALTIWSSSIQKDSGDGEILSLFFSLLSVITLWEVVHPPFNVRPRIKFWIFRATLLLVQFGMVMYTLETYYKIVLSFLALLSTFFILLICFAVLVTIARFIILKVFKGSITDKNTEIVTGVVFFPALYLTYHLSKYLVYFLKTYTYFFEILK